MFPLQMASTYFKPWKQKVGLVEYLVLVCAIENLSYTWMYYIP